MRVAIIFKLDPEQLTTLVTAIANLSDNIAKWQGDQVTATENGFADLVSALGGTSDEQQQVLINQLATALNLSTDEVEAVIKQSQPKKGNDDNGS
jgi:flagellar motor switch protein FliG